MAGIEGRGRNTAVRRELQHLAVDPRMIGGDIPAEALVLAAGAGFQRPGLLRIQRHETGAAEAALHQVAEIRHVLARSEEHTSELQSLMRISYAVFCLKK